MAKGGGVQQLLLDKGEKIGLGIGAAMGALLLILGVMEIFKREDPDTFAKAVDQKDGALRSAMNGEAPKLPALEGPIVSAAQNQPLQVSVLNKPLFDQFPAPDERRIAPLVKRVIEGQVDIASVKIPGWDIVIEREPTDDTIVKLIRLGVLTSKTPKEKPPGTDEFLNSLRKHTRMPRRNPNYNGMMGNLGMAGGGMIGGPAPPGGMGGFPAPPGGMGGFPAPPGGMGGFPAPPGGMGGGIRGDSGVGFGGGMAGLGMAGGLGMTGVPQNQTRTEVDYIEGVTEADLDTKMNGRKLAVKIHPVRMAVIQASFPYREQIEAFRTALRYQTVENLYANLGDMPVFNGVEIQRRGFNPDGSVFEDWLAIDPITNIQNQDLRAFALQDRDDPVDLQRVMMPEDYGLVMPLPQELVGKYPDMKLQTVKDAIKKLKDAGGKVNVPPAQNRFLGSTNPFSRNRGANAGGLIGGAGAGEDAGAGFGALQGFNRPPAKGGMDPMAPAAGAKIEPPDVAYIRMIDPSIAEGVIYQYRIRVKLMNPNYGKKDWVAKHFDSEYKEMPLNDDHWFEIPSRVQVPNAAYYYVIDPVTVPAKDKPNYVPPTPRDGQALLQVQRWLMKLELKGGTEDIGDWIQVDKLATRGEYVRGNVFAPLPFWSSVFNDFTMRVITEDAMTKLPKGKEPRRGTMIEPFRAKSLFCVDLTGGKVRSRIPANPGENKTTRNIVEEESAMEVLFVAPDGKLQVQASYRDRIDPDRKERDDNFKKWVKETEEKTKAQNPGTTTPGKSDF